MPDRIVFDSPGAPVSIEYIRRDGPFRMPADHYHNFYEIYYLLSGERRYFIRDRSYGIQPGDLVFVDRQELHQTTDAGSPSHERIVIYFHEPFVRQHGKAESELLLAPFRRDNPVLRPQMRERLLLDALMAKLKNEMQEKDIGHELAIRQGVTELLLLAARLAERSDAAAAALDTPLYRKMSDIARCINARYAEPLSLPSLAAQFHISPYYLSRMFKQAIGLTISEYINITRIRAAEQLLKETDLSVIDVSAAVGYNNISHFGKMFKKLAKVSPRDFRRS